MSPVLGWSLAAVGVAVGYMRWGWPGVFMAVTMIVFWLLLQFSRAIRVMKKAGSAPVGHVASAVMLHSRLKVGMRLLEILPLTGALGVKLSDDPETFGWTDASGASVKVELVRGRCAAWSLERPEPSPTDPSV